MSVFSDLRAQLVADLEPIDGATVHPSWPDVVVPPFMFVTPPLSDDWARRGENFGEHTIGLDLVVLVDHGDAATELATLESLVEQALKKIDDWDLLGVEPPTPTTVSDGGAEYLATVIRVSKPVEL